MVQCALSLVVGEREREREGGRTREGMCDGEEGGCDAGESQELDPQDNAMFPRDAHLSLMSSKIQLRRWQGCQREECAQQVHGTPGSVSLFFLLLALFILFCCSPSRALLSYLCDPGWPHMHACSQGKILLDSNPSASLGYLCSLRFWDLTGVFRGRSEVIGSMEKETLTWCVLGIFRQSRGSSVTPSTTTCKEYHAWWRGADMHWFIVIWDTDHPLFLRFCFTLLLYEAPLNVLYEVHHCSLPLKTLWGSNSSPSSSKRDCNNVLCSFLSSFKWFWMRYITVHFH